MINSFILPAHNVTSHPGNQTDELNTVEFIIKPIIKAIFFPKDGP